MSDFDLEFEDEPDYSKLPSTKLQGPMKVAGMLFKRDDIDLEAFNRHWREVNGPLMMRLKQAGYIRDYVQNHKVAELEGIEPAGDGCVMMWADTLEDIITMSQSAEYFEGAEQDEENFMDGPPSGLFVIEDLVFEQDKAFDLDKADALAEGVKLIAFVRHKEEVDLEEFQNEWMQRRQPLIGVAPDNDDAPQMAPLRYVRSFLSPALYFVGPMAFDGVEEIWFPTLEALEAAWKARTPAEDMIDLELCQAMAVREVRMQPND